jgi:hypothetical protein
MKLMQQLLLRDACCMACMPVHFDELMKPTKTGFDDPLLLDHVKAAKLELADMLHAMVEPDDGLFAAMGLVITRVRFFCFHPWNHHR